MAIFETIRMKINVFKRSDISSKSDDYKICMQKKIFTLKYLEGGMENDNFVVILGKKDHSSKTVQAKVISNLQAKKSYLFGMRQRNLQL